LYRWQQGAFTVLGRSDGLAGDTVRSLLADSAGNLWIGLEVSNCLQRLREGQWHTFTQPPGSRTIRVMAEDAAHNIWMGTSDGYLLRVDGDTLVNETPRTLSRPKPIRCLYATPDGSLWIGYAGAGVGRLREGRFVQVGTEQGLHDDYVCGIVADEGGALWFAADHGIFQVRQRELDEVAEGRVQRVRSVVYGRDEALPSLQGSYGYSRGAVRSRDGRIWFPMQTGLAIVHPDRVQPNRIPPPVLVERVTVDGRPVELRQGSSSFMLSPGHRKLEVDFTAPCFVAPESVRFRQRLEGWDENWIEVGTLRSASYSRLPAGTYQFHVTACNNAGVWNQQGATLGFVVQPFFWQTWWFRLAVLAGFTLSVIALVRYLSFRRLRLKLRQLEQEAALYKERTRIAKDIHDDLGASLTEISLLGELAQHDFSTAGTARGHVEKIAVMARDGIRALDEIVWAVNPRNDTLAHLIDYVGQFAVDFLRVAAIRCRLDFPEQPPVRAVSAEVRHNFFLVAKEALHNVVKHAQATEVWLRVNVSDARLQLTVEDNGSGFDCPPENAWADGLRNMRERLAEMGGKCQVRSQGGLGTKVIFEVPWQRT
jgi:signal transduction histidine kinase/streptogramin lyase